MVIEAGDFRVSAEYAGFFSTLVHAIRNAVDHGRPKSLRLAAQLRQGEFEVSVQDDGAGIDWERVAAVASKKGLPCETGADLVEALFTDGVSTRAQASEISGRGVGLAALRAKAVSLGGAVSIVSRGVGSRVSFVFPADARVCSSDSARAA